MPEKGPIKQVLLFASNIGEAKILASSGVGVQHMAPKELFPRADIEMGFGGTLVSYMSSRDLLNKFEVVPEMSEEEWVYFINKRIPPGWFWQKWTGRSPTCIYTVLVLSDQQL